MDPRESNSSNLTFAHLKEKPTLALIAEFEKRRQLQEAEAEIPGGPIRGPIRGPVRATGGSAERGGLQASGERGRGPKISQGTGYLGAMDYGRV